MKGIVYLVGGGPGDPELLTLKAVDRLRSAEIVLHDALISSEVLAFASADARLISVGKRCGSKCITQDEINSLLVDFAKQGHVVVRLKSGDPSLFGRAGEEIDALTKARIDFEIVPGITSAEAAAAAARISLTDRRCAEQVMLVSAHHAPGKPGPDWRDLISAHTTIAIYMPGHHANIAQGLMDAGLNEHTPCILISKISDAEELAYRTTVGTLRTAPALPAPSLLIVGETAAASSLPEFKSASCNEREASVVVVSIS